MIASIRRDGGDGTRVTLGQRRVLALLAGLCGFAISAASFTLLPLASGQSALAGRQFDGPELARLARNVDIVLGGAAGGPAALLLVVALYAVPAAALAGALLLAGAGLSRNRTAALRAASGAGVFAIAVLVIVVLMLAVGPQSGEVLSRRPGTGMVVALAGAGLGVAGSWHSARLTRRT